MMDFALDLDFLGRPRAAPWWAWALLLLGAAAMVAAGNERARAGAQLASAQAHHESLQARWQAAHASEASLAAREASPGRKAGADPAQTQQLREVQEVGHALTHPWGELLAAIEQASDPSSGVALLGLRHAVASSDISIDAVVKDDGAALRLVDALGTHNQVLSQVLLRSRDVLTQAQGELTEHVQIGAVLKADAPAAQAAPAPAAASASAPAPSAPASSGAR